MTLSDLKYYPPGKGYTSRLTEDESTRTLIINLHGLSELKAMDYILALWKEIEPVRCIQICHLEIIHGYRHGDVLQGLVKLFFEDKSCVISEAYRNPGVTHIFL